MTSNQAGRLPSILDVVRDFMIEEGMEPSLIKVFEHGISYDGWQLVGTTPQGEFYMIPFKTNDHAYANPADPEFFTFVRECLVFPELNEQFGPYWDATLGHKRWVKKWK